MAGVVGVVLAGGRSTRFGSEKAVARVGRAPMIAHVAAVLAHGCDAVAVNAPPQSEAAAWARAQGLEVLPDPPGAPDGPLAGVLAGLEWGTARGAHVVVTAPCDTPRLPRRLTDRLAEPVTVDAVAAFVVTPHGPQPLCAAWSVELQAPLRRALRDGAHPSVSGWLRWVGAREVRFTDATAFANLNRPPRRLGGWARLAGAALGLALLWTSVAALTPLLLLFGLASAIGDPVDHAPASMRRAVLLGVAALALIPVVVVAATAVTAVVGRAALQRARRR